jgi:branched-chain amino acid transport system substrate-binding protein
MEALHQTRKLIGPIASLCALLGLMAVQTACSKPAPIQIGFVGGLSSRTSDLGISSLNGAILATELRNAAGGINGRPVELVVRDDDQKQEIAYQAVREMIGIRVAAIIGPLTSNMSIATIPLANDAGVVMISPTTTTNELTGKDDYFFRVLSPTATYATESARFHRNVLKHSKVAVIYDRQNSSYSESWLNDFRRVFEKEGGRVTLALPFRAETDSNLSSLARRLVENRPDGILIIANSVDVALLCKQIRSLAPDIPISTSDWSGTEQLIELGGKAVEGVTFTQYIDRFCIQPGYVAFRQNFLKRFRREPGFAGVTTYDATNVLFDALSRKKPGDNLKDTILSIRTFEGLQDPIVFNDNGEAERKVFMSIIRNGQFVSLSRE